MTQQVIKANIEWTSLSPFVDNPSIDIIVEQLGSSTALVYSTVNTLINTSFNTILTGGVRALTSYLSPVISRAANTMLLRFYDITAHLDGTAAGSPVYSASLTPAALASGTTAGPEGVSLLWGYQAAYGSDTEFGPGTRPRARDRGRNYIGPIGAGWWTADAQSRAIWSDGSIVPDALKAIANLTTPVGTSDAPAMVQWSRANHAVKQIISYYVEDGPRYQRRRVDLANKLTH